MPGQYAGRFGPARETSATTPGDDCDLIVLTNIPKRLVCLMVKCVVTLALRCIETGCTSAHPLPPPSAAPLRSLEGAWWTTMVLVDRPAREPPPDARHGSFGVAQTAPLEHVIASADAITSFTTRASLNRMHGILYGLSVAGQYLTDA